MLRVLIGCGARGCQIMRSRLFLGWPASEALTACFSGMRPSMHNVLSERGWLAERLRLMLGGEHFGRPPIPVRLVSATMRRP